MDNTISLNKDIISSKSIAAFIGVAFFVITTALGAYIRIPVPGSPVPITLQTLFVILSGAIIGKRLGLFSQFAYVVLGCAGFSIFQGPACGLPYLAGPTGGYLIGFIVAAYAVGALTASGRGGLYRTIAAFAAGSLIIYTFGAIWLICLYRMDIPAAICAGILPFIPGDIAKTILACLIYSAISQRSKRIFAS